MDPPPPFHFLAPQNQTVVYGPEDTASHMILARETVSYLLQSKLRILFI